MRSRVDWWQPTQGRVAAPGKGTTHSSAASRFVGSRTLEKSSASATSEMNEMPLCINTHIEDALGVENGMDN